MKTIFLSSLILISSVFCFGQSECGTPSNFPNLIPTYNLENGGFNSETTVCLRVYFHIVRNSAGTNGYNPNNISQLITLLNQGFNSHGIIVVNSGQDFINNDVFGIEFNDGEFNSLTSTQNVPNTVNIYLLPVNPIQYAGRASAIPGNSLVMGFTAINTNILVHELGHCLNLFHTHHQLEINNCANNSNSWNDCGECSDFVCDTPIDPQLGCSGNVNPFTCAYTGTGNYNPDTRNFMSYTCFDVCMDRFTVGQGQRMKISIINDPMLKQFISTDCIKIQGESNLCSQNTAQIYSVQNAPINSTFNWTWTNNCPNYLPNGSQCSITKGICIGSTLLTCTVTSPSGIFTISKTISFVNPPNEYLFVPYITNGSSTTYMSNYCNKLTNICSNTRKPDNNEMPPISDIISPNNYCASGYITDASATSITWSVEQTSPGTFHGYYNFNDNQFSVGINLNYPNEWIILKCTRTNACGSFSHSYRFYAGNNSCLAPASHCAVFPNDAGCAVEAKQPIVSNDVLIYPNPSTGKFRVTLSNNKSSNFIKNIVIYNNIGLPIYDQGFKDNRTFQEIVINVPVTGIYTLKVFDGEKWNSVKVSLLK